ncbi:MAG: dodecin family protein [Cryobacterium sp.]
MTVARVTTLSVRSEKSFEDAVAAGIERSHKTLRGISGAWVKEQKVVVEGGRITAWDVVIEVTFVLED